MRALFAAASAAMVCAGTAGAQPAPVIGPPMQGVTVVTDTVAGGALRSNGPVPAMAPYPPEARARGDEGFVVLSCVRRECTCTVERETPIDAGFGAAALGMSGAVLAAHDGDIVRVPIVYAIEGSARASVWMPSFWEKRPTARSFDRNYPRPAAAKGLGADTVLSCTIRDDRRLDCTVVSESVAGEGFGEAAVKISRDFLLKAEALGPLGFQVGDTLRVPIGFRIG